jgi:hypothetical protein
LRLVRSDNVCWPFFRISRRRTDVAFDGGRKASATGKQPMR